MTGVGLWQGLCGRLGVSASGNEGVDGRWVIVRRGVGDDKFGAGVNEEFFECGKGVRTASSKDELSDGLKRKMQI